MAGDRCFALFYFIKTKNTASNIETVLTQNEKLKELIQKELKQ